MVSILAPVVVMSAVLVLAAANASVAVQLYMTYWMNVEFQDVVEKNLHKPQDSRVALQTKIEHKLTKLRENRYERNEKVMAAHAKNATISKGNAVAAQQCFDQSAREPRQRD